MTLITAVVLGFAAGYFLGFGRRALLTWSATWAVVLFVQSTVVLDESAFEDGSYWPIQAAILGIGVLVLWLGAKLRAWRLSK